MSFKREHICKSYIVIEQQGIYEHADVNHIISLA